MNNVRDIRLALEELGLDGTETVEEAKLTYKTLINLVHPDKVSRLKGAPRKRAEDQSKKINAAWKLLKPFYSSNKQDELKVALKRVKPENESNINDRKPSESAKNNNNTKKKNIPAVLTFLAFLSLLLWVGSRDSIDKSSGSLQSYQQSHSGTAPNSDGQYTNPEDEIADFIKVILAETEQTWSSVFTKYGTQYRPPKLVVYSGVVRSSCGTSSSASGPFYCTGDEKIYIDLSFLNEIKKMGVSSDFSFAYVIAHEVGHHVQKLTGVTDEVRRNQRSASKTQSNAIQVRMELQADCLAGVWINHTQSRQAILEQGDIEEGMNAAAAVGEGRISRGRLPRHSYTHGSSRERIQWFQRGMQTGEASDCNSFVGLK